MSDSRPPRVRAAPARLHDEQAAAVDYAALLSSFRNPAAFSPTPDDDNSSDDEESGPEVGEERKENDRRPPAYAWSSEHSPVQPVIFSPPRRPAHALDALDSALQFFQLFITDDFLDACVQYTNEYATQRHSEEQEKPLAGEWTNTTCEELKAMIGCLIYMGIVCMNDTRDYWAQATAQPFVTSTFSRDRFLSLLANFRVSEDEENDEDQLSKLRNLIDILTASIQQHHYPGAELTIDEAMILFKGRSSMRQHIAKKASPTGFKVWMLVDVESNYVYSFDIYTGKSKSKREENATAAIVLKLIEPLTDDCWHRIGMDSFFTSVQLFEKLLSKGFYAVGTTRHNRKHFPKQILDEVKECERGEYVWRQHDQIVCFSWMDKKPVNLLSTFCDAQEQSVIKRRAGRELLDVACPSVVPTYLRTMRGVDVFSQRQSYSKIGRRSKKWFYSLVWFMFDMAIHNAFILYQKKHNQQHYAEKDFRKQLMDQLVNGFSSRRKKGRVPTAAKRYRDSLHTIQHSPSAKDCHECRNHRSSGQRGRRTHWQCSDCNISLCIPHCYNKHIQTLTVDAEISE